MLFKDLPNDAAFIFACEKAPGWQGARGPWAKVDRRSYVRLLGQKGAGTCIRVGTINAKVERF